MITGSNMKEDCKSLMAKCVCDITAKDCMLQRCQNCPGKEVLEEYIDGCLTEVDEEEEIIFKQWEKDRTTERESLRTEQLSRAQFIQELAEKIVNLCPHHYVARHQNHYLKSLKEEMTSEEAIVLMDFSENFSFVVQDEAQSFHWNNTQATVHPFVVYFKDENNKLDHKSFTVVSDCLKHDAITVHVFLAKFINFLKEKLPNVRHIHYFSDGCGGQYKNYKNFINLCYHAEDFGGLTAEWNFFATSHGKSVSDGIGGTVKRATARFSLQRREDPILTTEQMYQFCKTKFQKENEKMFFANVKNDEVEAAKAEQEKRFENGRTIAGTRENHQFTPVNNGQIEVRRVSRDVTSLFLANVTNRGIFDEQVPLTSLQVGQYVACVYDSFWFLGSVLKICLEENDVQVNFMQPHGPAQNFSWPLREDICWVPQQHILMVVEAPTCSSAYGRSFELDRRTVSKIKKHFEQFKRLHLRLD